MANNPEGVVPSDIQVQLFYKILKEAYSSIGLTLTSGTPTTQARKRKVLGEIQKIFNEADDSVQAWIKVEIPTFYEMGMFSAIKLLDERGTPIRIDKEYVAFHKQAIEAIAQDAYSSISKGIQGMVRSAEHILQQTTQKQVLERIAKGSITGEANKTIAKDIAKMLKDEGLTAITDKAGRDWDLLTYSEMLSRTKLTQAHNSGVVNRTVENGNDLVIVSDHFGTCDLCAPFQGRILSATGRNEGYLSLDDAMAEGLFHPNCRHVITPYYDAYLDASVAWDASKQKYVAFTELPTQKINVKLPSFDEAKNKDLETKGMSEYIKAFNSGDLKTLEKIRNESPEDARFNTHLKYLKGVVESGGQDVFSKVVKLNDSINKDIGISGVAEFNKLLEGGNKQKIENFVDKLPDSNELKDSMYKLLEYL